MTKAAEGIGSAIKWVRPTGVALGFAVALGLQLLPLPEGLSREGWIVASMALMMVIFWFTEALPLPVTALIPLFALPVFAGLTPAAAAVPYANPIILLFIGGFMMAIAIERWRLSTRIAYSIVAAAGSRPKLIVAGFLIAAAGLSMWISNTATSLIMTPLALGVAAAAGGDKIDWRYAAALALGISWAASIGGIGTPIGTPTNLIALSWLREQTGAQISFLAWMVMALPLIAVMLLITWVVLTHDLRIERSAGEQAQVEVRGALAALGRVTQPELRVCGVFLLIAGLWVSVTWLNRLPGLEGLNEMSIGILAALVLFLVPAGGEEGRGRALLTWDEAVKLPWGIMLLFGGGLSLAAAATATGLGEWLGQSLGGLAGAPTWMVVGSVVLLPLVLSQFTSNIASISMLLPVFGPLALTVGMAPAMLAAPAALAASFAVLTPVASANQAIAYASGKVPLSYMMSRGVIMLVAGLIFTTLVGLYWTPRMLGG